MVMGQYLWVPFAGDYITSINAGNFRRENQGMSTNMLTKLSTVSKF